MLKMQRRNGEWQWCGTNHFGVCPSEATAHAHLLAALLPRAVNQWTWKHRSKEQFGPIGWFQFPLHERPPHTLESAIAILEDA